METQARCADRDVYQLATQNGGMDIAGNF